MRLTVINYILYTYFWNILYIACSVFIALYSVLGVLKCLVLNLSAKIHIWPYLGQC